MSLFTFWYSGLFTTFGTKIFGWAPKCLTLNGFTLEIFCVQVLRGVAGLWAVDLGSGVDDVSLCIDHVETHKVGPVHGRPVEWVWLGYCLYC